MGQFKNNSLSYGKHSKGPKAEIPLDFKILAKHRR